MTRTSLNQGILQSTGYVNEENLNEANVWSLSLLQMDFFYRKRKWYAGQFVRKVIPKFITTKNNVKFFSVILNQIKPILLQVLVRNVDKTFENQIIALPTKNNQIDFDFMESFIQELEAERIQELEAYLSTTGLNDYHLSEQEKKLLKHEPNLGSFTLASSYFMRKKLINVDNKGLFDIVPTKKKINANSITFDGQFPYVARGESKNGIRGYIDFDEQYLNPKNTISFGQDTATMYYQPKAYYTGDKIQVFKLNEAYGTLNENVALYIISSMKKSFANFIWGQQSFALDAISKIPVELPIDDFGDIDFEYMCRYITAVKKITIANVVKYKDEVISATKNIVE